MTINHYQAQVAIINRAAGTGVITGQYQSLSNIHSNDFSIVTFPLNISSQPVDVRPLRESGSKSQETGGYGWFLWVYIVFGCFWAIVNIRKKATALCIFWCSELKCRLLPRNLRIWHFPCWSGTSISSKTVGCMSMWWRHVREESGGKKHCWWRRLGCMDFLEDENTKPSRHWFQFDSWVLWLICQVQFLRTSFG